jgi:uncharacterized protein
VNTLDPRAPLVLDTQELGRRAGSMVKRHFTVPAPADLGTDVIGVTEGDDLELDFRLEGVIEGVLVSGVVIATATGECARCLQAIAQPVEIDFQELFEYPDAINDEDSLRLVDDLLDLEPVVRDAIVLSLPLAPLCKDDCRGLCSQCGVDLNKKPNHQHDNVDERWQALQGLLKDIDPTEG